MTLVLSPEELVSLTGYKQPARQAKWLKTNGFKFIMNRFKQPKVDRAHYHAKMGLGKIKEPEPNWTAKQGAINEQQPARARRAGPVPASRQAPGLVLLQASK
ncbi:DUF4224 domain-containing protein [Rhodoferax fermentans]|uniref:DUF4224 domain-containing protein n=1 Tax=Rhodoferax fermentans TaxID=28066 RepID=A0A1T1ANX8_RHOFE|nr:DUF4224 domain-containing protein [Rhodoferax fermentans]MBK1683438.1 DUF4224 domain-containing protein [Rhodoferax fermentans]OOV05819.1 hypothetical protein RF819_03015 [Rhodoferax fermentans]